MVMLRMTRSYLADVRNLKSPIQFGTADRSDDRQLNGEVREMANGRLVSVTTWGDRRVFDITAVQVSPFIVSTLVLWRGRTVLFRDVWGRKVYGVYYDTSIKDYRDRSGQDVKFTLQQTSWIEGKVRAEDGSFVDADYYELIRAEDGSLVSPGFFQ